MYQALYRKWRPRTFSDVSGQSHVTKTLTHEIESGRLFHAYLFTGSRGTGKTTCARILAKAVNCLSPVSGNPCGECEICRGIDFGSLLDVIEIDAASNSGVDNIRDLREEANFTPVTAKYRVYIIDEVHELSIDAFNALLKILEEPPAHVVFILATTEVHKLPATILSRCQRFDFKHIPPEAIADRLKFVAENEKITLTDEAATLIARIADGALRDALSLLDRCAANGEEVTADMVSACAGLTGRDYLFKMAKVISSKDTCSAIQYVSDLNSESCSMERLCTELINHFRNLMISKTVKSAENLIICSQNELDELKNQASLFTLEEILDNLSILEETSLNLKSGLDRRVEMEMAIIRLCNPALCTSNSSVLKRIAAVEAAVSGGAPIAIQQQPIKKMNESSSATPAPAAPAENPVVPEKTQKPMVEKSTEAPVSRSLPSSEGNTSSKETLLKSWPEILEVIKSSSKPLSGVLLNSSAYIKDNTVYVKSPNAAFEQFLNIPTYHSAIESAVFSVTGTKYRIDVYKIAGGQGKADPLSDLISKINSLG